MTSKKPSSSSALSIAPRGVRCVITAPSWFAGQAFAKFLADYRRRYPEIVLDLSLEDRDVDIVAEGYDLALRVTRGELPAGLIARRVHSVRLPDRRLATAISTSMVPRVLPRNLRVTTWVGIGDIDTCR